MGETVVDTIQVELLPWLPGLVGQDEHRRLRLEVEFRPDETVLQFLFRLGEQYPALLAELWDSVRQELRMPIEVAINGAVIGIHHRLNSLLEPGDQVLLLPQYQGG